MSNASSAIVEAARRIAHERPLEVLERLAGISSQYLDGKHHPCPWRCVPDAGGKDRFSLVDRATGAVLCRKCFDRENGDCIAAVMKYQGLDFLAACKLIVSNFGDVGDVATPQPGRGQAPPEEEGKFEVRELDFYHAKIYSERKGGIVPEALRRVGAKLTTHFGTVCVAIPFCGESLDITQPTSWKKLHIFGIPFEWADKDGTKRSEKSLSTPGPSGGWAGEVARLKSECFGNDKPASPRVIVHTEGEPDLLALLSHRSSLPAELIGLTNQCGAGEDPAKKPWMLAACKGHHFAAIADNDDDGRKAAKLRAARAIEAGCATARVIELPWRGDEPKQKDLRDWFIAGHTAAELVNAFHNAPKLTKKLAKEYIKKLGKKEPKPSKKKEAGPPRQTGLDLPQVLNGTDIHRIVDEFIANIARARLVFRRGPTIVEIRGAIDGHEVCVSVIDEHRLRDICSKVLRFGECKKDGVESGSVSLGEALASAGQIEPHEVRHPGFEDRHIPREVLKSVLARGEYPDIPALVDVCDTPVFVKDGSLVTENGWDSRGVYVHCSLTFPLVKGDANRSDAVAAAKMLLSEVIGDFRFADPGACRSAWLCAVVTPFARPMFDGPVPLWAIDAAKMGSGKGLLADTVLIIATGNTKFPRTTLGKDETENRKLLTSLIARGSRFIFFDDNNRIGGNALQSIITATAWEDRLLGGNAMLKQEVRAMFFACGNQLKLTGDMPRRTMHIRIDPQSEKPWERGGFKHPDLRAFVSANRARFAVAALTILKAYLNAGCPMQQIPNWGSFEAWSSIVRNAIVWLGFEDPFTLSKQLTDDGDEQLADLRRVIAAWEAADPGRHGLTVNECLERISQYGTKSLGELFDFLMSPRVARNARSIGKRLARFQDQISDGLAFRSKSVDHVKCFYVQRVPQEGENQPRNPGNPYETPAETPPPKPSHQQVLTTFEGVSGVSCPTLRTMSDDYFLDGEKWSSAYREGWKHTSESPKPLHGDFGGCPTCGTALVEVATFDGWLQVQCNACDKVIGPPRPQLSKVATNGAEVPAHG